MTNNALLKYADILVAISQGKTIQCREYPHKDWLYGNNFNILGEIASGDYSPARYRVKPDGIDANGVTIPRPLQANLPLNSVYWFISSNHTCGYHEAKWTDHPVDHSRLAHRQIWASESETKQAVEALAALLST